MIWIIFLGIIFGVYFLYWILGLLLIWISPEDRVNVKECFIAAPIFIYMVIFVLFIKIKWPVKSYEYIVTKLFGEDK